MKRLLTLVTALVLAGSFFAACSDSKDDPAVDSSNTTAAVGESGSGAPADVTLTASNFAFDPGTLNVASGKVVIEFKNDTDGTEHNLTIEDLSVDKDLEAGETTKVTIDDAKPGVYDYFCEYHPSTMKGTLAVG